MEPGLNIYNPFTINSEIECKISNLSNKFPPDGQNYGDYIYWDNQPAKWATGNNQLKLGANAGKTGQKAFAIAIGDNAGNSGQGTNAIAIGRFAGKSNQPPNTIVLNASGFAVNPPSSNGFFVAPVRNASSTNNLFYNPTTNEITYNSVAAPPNSSNISIIFFPASAETTSLTTSLKNILSSSANCTFPFQQEFIKVNATELGATYTGTTSSKFRIDLSLSSQTSGVATRALIYISKLPNGSAVYTNISAPIITVLATATTVVSSSMSCFVSLNQGDSIFARVQAGSGTPTFSLHSYQLNISPAPF